MYVPRSSKTAHKKPPAEAHRMELYVHALQADNAIMTKCSGLTLDDNVDRDDSSHEKSVLEFSSSLDSDSGFPASSDEEKRDKKKGGNPR